QTADASHFRGGTITWAPDASANCLSITVVHRWDNFNFVSPLSNPSIGDTYSWFTSFSGGQTGVNHTFQVTAENETEDWFEATSTFTKCFTGPGCYEIINISTSCCWAGDIAGPGGDFSLRSFASVGGGSCNGQPSCSASPVIGAPPILGVPANTTNWVYQPPISNPGGANLSFRFATGSEIGGFYTPSSGLSIDPNSGQISWNQTPSSTFGFHLIAMVAEGGSCETKQMFLLKVGGSTSTPPLFTGGTPANNQVFDICVGDELNFDITATDPDNGDIVTINASGLPNNPIPTFSPTLPVSGTQSATTSFTYTPTSTGSFGAIFSATDNNGATAFTNIVINVTDNNCGAPPEITPDFLGPNGGICIEPGVVFNQLYTATDADPGDSVIIDSASFTSFDQMALVNRNNFTPNLPVGPDATASTTFSWTPTPAEWGRHTFLIYGEDESGDRDTANISLYVDREPSFTSNPPDDLCINEGDEFTYAITAVDPDVVYGDSIWIRLMPGAPSWLSLTDNGGFQGDATLTGTPGAGDIGTHTVTLRIVYLHHNWLGLHCNHVDQTFEICVDNLAPIAACDDVTVSVGTEGYAVLTPLMLDNNSIDQGCSSIDSMWVSQDTFLCSEITKDTVHMVTLTVRDCAGNTNMCWSEVTVDDKIPPVIVCPGDTVINCTEGIEPAITGMASATDNCEVDSIVWSDVTTQDPNPDSCGHYAYTITRTWIAFDKCGFIGPGEYGLSDTCVQTIMVQDTTKPEWTSTCDDFYAGQDSIDCTFSVDCNDPNLQGILAYELAKSPEAEDECKLDRVEMITNDTILGCPSVIIREWLAYDACENETCDTFRQTITIIDTIPPHLVCPNGGNTINLAVEESCDTSITVEAMADDCDAFAGYSNLDENSWQYSIMNSTTMNVMATGTASSFPTPTLPLGTYMVTFMVADQCGNMATCQTSIVVTDGSDPEIDCDIVTDDDGNIISGTVVDTTTD
ncbi:MAG: hypothetical protein AAGK97_04365, partial [Bacteroidota bacterium]